MTNIHKTINRLIKDDELSFLSSMDSMVLNKTPSKTRSYMSNGEKITYQTKAIEEDYIKIWTIPYINKTIALSFNFDKNIVSLSTENKIKINTNNNFAEHKDELYEEAKNHKCISYTPEDFKERLKDYLQSLRKTNVVGNTDNMLSFFGLEGY